MNAPEKEIADYIIRYYSNLLTMEEGKALRHCRSTFKLGDNTSEKMRQAYYKTGWLNSDPQILVMVENGYEQFAINCTKRILAETPDKVHFNLCPECGRLARTPFARQCRWCGHDWH